MVNGEEYYTTRVEKGADGVRALIEAYTEAHNGQRPKAVFLNPEAIGGKVAEIMEAAEAEGLKVERHPFVLKWEVWVGG